jgi:hypothetical protein
VTRHLLARAWAAGSAPFTIDLNSTIRETYGLAKRATSTTGIQGCAAITPLLAVAAGTGDILAARLREGRGNTVRGAAHFLTETIGRVPAAVIEPSDEDARWIPANDQPGLRQRTGIW